MTKFMKELFAHFDNCVFIDIETTGLSPHRDEIIEIGALKIVGGKVSAQFSTLIEPSIKIPYYATKVNGITNKMVEGAPRLKDVAGDFLNFVGNMVVVAHNAQFDLSFLKTHLKKAVGADFSPDYIDTLKVARELYPYASSNSLKALSQRLGVDYTGAHRALADCHITHKCTEIFKEELGQAI